MQNRFLLPFFSLLAVSIPSSAPLPAIAQSLPLGSPIASSLAIAAEPGKSGFASSTLVSSSVDSGRASFENPADSDLLPAAPEPAAAGAGGDHYEIAPSATWYQAPFSRIGIGADINPLGIGIKSAIVLNHYFDARIMANFFGYDTGRVEVEGFNVNTNLHMASGAAALDWYPFGSVWRLSPGVLFVNGNQVSGTVEVVAGNSFSLVTQNYYSAYPNAKTGATPLTGSGALGLHTKTPAFTATFGFGKFIPRSERHWSFPSEFGVAFTGAPAINVKVAGWACLDEAQTQCSNVGDPTNPIAIEFNNDLQSRLNKWRKDLDKVRVYPLFSYSVMYSFNIR